MRQPLLDYGQCVYLPAGAGALVNTANFNPDTYPNWTMAGWFNVTKATGNVGGGAIFSNDGSHVLYISDNTTPGIANYTLDWGATLSNGTFKKNGWHHWVLTRSGNTFTIYIDGVSQSTVTGSATTTTSNFIVGAQIAGGSYSMTGWIDEVQFYTTALTQAQVTQLYGQIGVIANAGNILYWAFDDSQSPATDLSGNGNTGILTATTYSTLVKSKARPSIYDFGTCLYNAANSYVLTPDSATLELNNTDFHISAWVNPTVSSSLTIACKGDGSSAAGTEYIFSTDPTNTVYFKGAWWSCPRFTINNSNIPIGKWTYLGVSYSNSTNILTFYINGIPVGTATITGTYASTTTTGLYLFKQGSASANPFNGYLDEIKIYKTFPTNAQILVEYQTKQNILGANLALYYKLDEGSGTTVTDSSGSGNTGTITGATYSTNVAAKPRVAVSGRVAAIGRVTP